MIVLLQHTRTTDPGDVVPRDASDAPPAHKKQWIIQQAEDKPDRVPAIMSVPQVAQTSDSEMPVEGKGMTTTLVNQITYMMLILFLQYIHTIVSDDEEDNSGGERQLKHHGIWNTMSLDELIPDDDPSGVISVCPVDLCTDVLPAKLSEPLASMVDRAKSLIRKHGTRDTLEFFKLRFVAR